jgi:hypothetical protein
MARPPDGSVVETVVGPLPAMHGANTTPYNPNYPTGGGNFNPDILIDTSHASVAPTLPPPKIGSPPPGGSGGGSGPPPPPRGSGGGAPATLAGGVGDGLGGWRPPPVSPRAPAVVPYLHPVVAAARHWHAGSMTGGTARPTTSIAISNECSSSFRLA